MQRNIAEKRPEAMPSLRHQHRQRLSTVPPRPLTVTLLVVHGIVMTASDVAQKLVFGQLASNTY